MPAAAAAISAWYAGLSVVGQIAFQIVLNVALSYVTQSLAGRKSADATKVRDGREVTVSGTTQPRQLIDGECVTGGYIAHFGLNNTTTTNNDFLWFAIVVAGHQVEEISHIWLDDRVIAPFEIDGGGSVNNSAFYSEAGTVRCFIYKHLGTHNQTYDATLGAWLTEWTSTHRGAGIAYFVVGLRKDDKAWPNGIPQTFRARVKGRRHYDPRLDSTNGGSGSQRYTDATTWAWTRNPILCARNYLTSGSVYFSTATPVTLLGLAESNARIEDAYIAAAANICDEHCRTPIPYNAFTNFGNGTNSSNNFSKTGGSSTWDSGTYSTAGVQKGTLTGKLYGTSGAQAFGFHTSAASITGGPNMAYGIYFHAATSEIQVVEGGAVRATVSRAPTTTDIARIDYTGTYLNYYLNDQLLWTTKPATANQWLYLSVLIYTPNGGISLGVELRYTCDTQLSCDATHADNMSTLLTSCVGHISYVNGKYRLFAGAYQTPAITLTEDDILGAVAIQTHPQGEDVYNSVTGTFYDEDRDWQQATFPTQTQSTYQADDGGLYQRSVELHATRSNYRAQRMANVILEQSRNKITIVYDQLSPNAMNIAEWDTFYVTSATLGYSAQAFRCTKWQFKSGFIGIEARIESATAYADLAVGSYTDPITNVPAASQVVAPNAPTGLGAIPAPGAIMLYVSTTLGYGEIVELWEHTSSSPFSSATKIDEGNKIVFTVFKNDDITRYYWVRKRKNGQYSATYPASTGTAGAAANVIQFVVTGNCVATNSTISKQGGVGNWDSQAYSVKGYTSCHAAFKLNSTGTDLAAGLNSDPAGNASYNSIDYAWVAGSGGSWSIFENGTGIGSYGTCSTSDLAVITYDGSIVTYWLNGVQQRTVAASGLTLYFDSSFYTVGTGINSVRFGPTTNVDTIDTNQISQEAVTEYYSASAGANSAFHGEVLLTISFTPLGPGSLDVSIAVDADADFDADSGTYCWVGLYQSGSFVASANAAVGWDSGSIRAMSASFGQVAVNGGVAYELRLIAAKAFGTLNIYSSVMTGLLRKV